MSAKNILPKADNDTLGLNVSTLYPLGTLPTSPSL